MPISSLLASYLLLLLATASFPSYAKVVGSQPITTHDYLARNALGSCGIPYSCLDVNRITAVQSLDKPVDCGTCLKVTCNSNPNNFVYVVAIDTGGQGLDLSTPSFQNLFGVNTGIFPASWAPTDPRNCLSVWRERPPSGLALPGVVTILNDIGGNTSPPPPMKKGTFMHSRSQNEFFSGDDDESNQDDEDIPMASLTRRQLTDPSTPVISQGTTVVGMNPSVVSSAVTTSPPGSSPSSQSTAPGAGVGSAIEETQTSSNDFVVNGTTTVPTVNGTLVNSTATSLAVNPTIVLSASMLLAWSVR